MAWAGASPVWLAAMTLQGRVLAGCYALGAMLGAGGMAQAYRARDRVLQRTVAVKVLASPYDQGPDLVARFLCSGPGPGVTGPATQGTPRRWPANAARSPSSPQVAKASPN